MKNIKIKKAFFAAFLHAQRLPKAGFFAFGKTAGRSRLCFAKTGPKKTGFNLRTTSLVALRYRGRLPRPRVPNLRVADGSFAAAIFLMLATLTANAHYPNESYIYLSIEENAVKGRFEIDLADMSRAMPIDADGSGDVSEAEFSVHQDGIYRDLEARLLFFDGQREFPVNATAHTFLRGEGRTFAQIAFEIPSLDSQADTLAVEFDVPLRDIDAAHKSRLLIENNVRTGVVGNETMHALVLEQGGSRQSFSLTGLPWWQVFTRFVAEGAWHIWIGWDHILFLIALLLVAVMNRQESTGGQWRPVGKARHALVNVMKVITLFTIAHTITLCLATLDLVRLPVTAVEVTIALSIAVAAWNNLRPLLGGSIGAIIFGFGLLHGFGFANVLIPLGLSQKSLITGLVGFNVGVELGQIALVMVLFPLLFAIRRWRGYQPVIIRGGSFVLIMIALFWSLERSAEWFAKQQFLTAAHPSSLGSLW